MPTKRCCSRCSTPFSICANKSCKCHEHDTDAVILDFPKGKGE